MTNRSQFKAVLFDIDGTLVDSEETHVNALLDVLKKYQISVADDFISENVGLPLLNAHERLVSEYGLPINFEELSAQKTAAYLNRRDELRPRRGALDALAMARSLGCRMAVVSNSDRIIVEANLQCIGMRNPDQITVSRNDVREGKPHPEPYLRAAWLMREQPDGCLVIEDSVPGAKSGLAAGMAVLVWPEPHLRGQIFPDGVVVCRDDNLAGVMHALAVQD